MYAMVLMSFVPFAAHEPGTSARNVSPLTACNPDRTQVTPTAVPTVAPTTGAFDGYSQSVDWATCGDLQCATIQVPLDWGNPGGDTIALKLNKLPATGEPQGSLLINPGGPGASGLDLTEYFGSIAGKELLGAYDVIGCYPANVAQGRARLSFEQFRINSFPSLASLVNAIRNRHYTAAKARFVVLACRGAGR